MTRDPTPIPPPGDPLTGARQALASARAPRKARAPARVRVRAQWRAAGLAVLGGLAVLLAWRSAPIPDPPVVADGPDERAMTLAIKPTPLAEAPGRPAPAAPIVALVVDDLGRDVGVADRVNALPARLTVAVLPYAPRAGEIAAAAARAGHEVFAHVPMEPAGLADPGPGALATWQGPADVARRAAAAFDAVPGARGFNNHMGSRFTACGRCLDPLLAEARARGLVALDSVTSPDSQLAARAAAAGLQALRRDVFLDHERTDAGIAERLAALETIARARGWAVGVGHPYEETLAALEDWIPRAQAGGVEIVPVGTLAARGYTNRPASAAARKSARAF